MYLTPLNNRYWWSLQTRMGQIAENSTLLSREPHGFPFFVSVTKRRIEGMHPPSVPVGFELDYDVLSVA
jgi:hypothetical protein